jgi:hypothetical protein
MNRRSDARYVRAAKRFRQKRYLFLKELLPPPLLEYLKVYYAILLADNRFSHDSQCPSSLSLGCDPALDALLEWIRPELGRLVGFSLAPTYSYTRCYAKGELLVRHVDRAACEISVTASIQIPKGAGPSVMYLKPPHAKEAKVEMLEGDGCVYAGTEVEHWRERFRVDGYIQLFLHFVARRGPHYPNLLFDGRERLGTATQQSNKKRDKRDRTDHTFRYGKRSKTATEDKSSQEKRTRPARSPIRRASARRRGKR